VYRPSVCFALLQGNDFTVSAIVVSLLFTALIYTVYEIGYIANDTETIKHETNPAMRLTANELAYYERHKHLIYGFRLMLNL